jgi:hypothetical protein
VLLLSGCPVTDADGDGFSPDDEDDPAFFDCDDEDAGINPGEVEICDDIDHDCVGGPWNGLALFSFWTDADGDGFGDADGDVLQHCAEQLAGAVEAEGDEPDCDDDDAAVFPHAEEICNGIDDDCDLDIDEGFDDDGDGFVDGADSNCAAELDAAVLDCDDGDPEIYPGAPERCNDKDDDCDGDVADEEADEDGDHFTPCQDDCNDAIPTINPSVNEACDGLDTDCDGLIDGDEVDLDEDTWLRCESFLDHTPDPVDADPIPNLGGWSGGDDCDDDDDRTYPGAPEVCDARDNDCDNLVDEDFDLDNDTWVDGPDCLEEGGYDELDCDDTTFSTHPGATEACDGVDSDCDGSLVDEFDDLDGDLEPDCTDEDTDGDGDLDTSDCDPLDDTVYTGAPESCDLIDSDCDGSLVDGYVDTDGDGTPDCVDDDDDNDGFPDAVDCDPLDDTYFPNAPELCDGLDTDCDGSLADEFEDFDGDDDPDCTDPDDDNDGDPDVTDCDDHNPLAFNGNTEIPDNFVDDDCSGADTVTCFVDADGDGVGVPQSPTLEVDGLCGDDLGESIFDTDCDDTDPTIFPGATELCDAVDSDCDGDEVDEFDDIDGDGVPDCIDADDDDDGFSIADGDCDDTNPTVFPGAIELCDGVDNDCDGLVDSLDPDVEDADFDQDGDPGPSCGGNDCNDNDPTLYSLDLDNDGVSPCDGDCDDDDSTISPAVDDIPYDGIDQDCDGQDLTDQDNDSHDSTVVGGDDCDDLNPYVNPDLPELCDGIDNDCDGLIDLSDPDFDYDGDNDGFATDGCGSTGDDCDDRDPHVFPDDAYTSGAESQCLPAAYPGFFHQWHFARISLPHFFEDDDGQQYIYLRGHERQPQQALGYSTSSDGGVTWSEPAGPILAGLLGEWDELNLSNPTVARIPDSEGLTHPYVMLYHAKDTTNLRQIGLASAASPEGPFERVSPIDGTTPIDDPVLPPSTDPAFLDANRTLHPSIRWDTDNSRLQLWYNGRSTASSTLRVFHATSTDYGLTWTRTDDDATPGPDVILEPTVGWEGTRTTQVSWLDGDVPGGPELLFWYTGSLDDNIGFAYGDATDWTRSPINPAFVPAGNCKRFDGFATSARGIRYDASTDEYHWYYGATTEVTESNPSAPCPFGNFDPVYGQDNVGNKASYVGHAINYAPVVTLDTVSSSSVSGTIEDSAPDLVIVDLWQDAVTTGTFLGSASVAPTGNTDTGKQITNWSVAVSLPSGPITLVVVATDEAGIMRQDAVTVTIP